jgi:hypothetical protein
MCTKLFFYNTEVVFQKKSLLKHIQIRSSFEDLVARESTVKTDHTSDKPSKSYNFLKFLCMKNNCTCG